MIHNICFGCGIIIPDAEYFVRGLAADREAESRIKALPSSTLPGLRERVPEDPTVITGNRDVKRDEAHR